MHVTIASNTGWIISVIILTMLLLIVVLLLIIVSTVYCKKLSNVTDSSRELNDYHEVSRYVNPHRVNRSSGSTASLHPNPAYGGAELQPQRRRQLNDNYDYVVSDYEMIKTDHNPSYIATKVGSNQMDDNPSYKPAFVAAV